MCGLQGCRHKTVLLLPRAGSAPPIALETVPPPKELPVIASVSPPELQPLPAQTPAPARRRRAAPPPPKDAAAAPPVQVASAPEPAAAAIGALSSGGTAMPESQQQAKDLIAGIVRRIAALPAKTADAQKSQVRQVKQFLDQAQQALNSGDADGAKNLATKAKLLLDDLEKQ